MPGIYGAVDIMAKDEKGNEVRWNPSKHVITEGSLEAELPMTRLAELFNVNHYIVSQVRVYIFWGPLLVGQVWFFVSVGAVRRG